MTLAERFRAFFAAANDGHCPYPWQIALVERIAESGAWPAAITAPTGSGKSSVVDVHVFLVAERERQRQAGTPEIARPPRRLVLVAPRRVLVDDQHERATRLAGLLQAADANSPLGEAREALASLITSAELVDLPLGVARLRGGVQLDLSWRLDPARCQIVCATPQMWGSRLLLRGFRGSARARNLESGLLAHDAAVVIDEAHLHRRLVGTSQRIAGMGRAAGRVQVIAMSATHSAPDSHALGPADFEDENLARRVHAPKSVEIELVGDWVRDRGQRLADAARRLREQSPDAGTVGVFVNTVAMALDVAARLKPAEEEAVCVICGRMRPADLDRVRAEFPGLLDARGDPDVDFLVSTQSLEVGVDLDLGAMATELAPAAALAQRAGRLNRSGSRPHSTLVVIAPEGLAAGDPDDFKAGVLPYTTVGLRDALGWLDELAGDASPHRISTVGVPEPQTTSLPDITSIELETLAMTSIALAADPDVSFYAEEPVDSEATRVSIAARDHLDLSEQVVREALEAAPPRAHELAAIAVGKALEGILRTCAFSWTIRTEGGSTTVFRTDPSARPLNGDVLVIPSGSRVTTGGVLGVPRGTGEPIGDVVAQRRPSGAGTPDVVVRLASGDGAEVAALAEADPVLGTRATRTVLAAIIERSGDGELANRLRTHRRLSDLALTWCADEEQPDAPGLLVVVASDREGRDTKRIAAATGIVTVDDHCLAVEDRAREIVRSLDGLVDDERDDVVLAALLHDEGKRHPEFQRRMGESPAGRALAKPAPGHKPDPGDGWRHEQLSAGVAHARSGRALVTALVAAHHGNGRPLFNRDERAVLANWGECPPADVDALAELFGPHGRYEADRAALQRDHGIHRLAYLEALIRCADIQVSREVQD
jgi:CRISPR-associated endonuclease/helicase Cas3